MSGLTGLEALKAASVPGLTDDEAEALSSLAETLERKAARNTLRKGYYEGKNAIKDLRISIPPPLATVDTVVGWPAKAVDMLAARSIFNGFTFKSGQNDLMRSIVRQNRLKQLYHQATTSELIGSCAFLTVSKGLPGEPDVLVSAYSSLNASARWNHRKRRIDAGLTVVEADKEGRPVWVNLYTDAAVTAVTKAADGLWTVQRTVNRQPRILMEPLIFRQSLDQGRPFGRSRISRAVMSITDSAVREALRTEVASEFFTAPQRYLLGADEDAFKTKDGEEVPTYRAYMASLIAFSTNEEGDIPQFGQLPQMSMQPHMEYMRSLAARFAGETNIPVESLGIIHDNPSSAEAIYAAKEDLIVEVNELNEANGAALESIGLLALAIGQNKHLDDLGDEERTITANFANPASPSIVSQSDAVVKMLAAMPEYAYCDVMLEELGFTEDQIMRLQAARLDDLVRANARAAMREATAIAVGKAAYHAS
ncbi:MAG: phage portal protein [Coriobacteriaceae bacterium]|jgi:hypothetical protein|nr:phage portal protein [Coriobacteriaceae bacterium]